MIAEAFHELDRQARAFGLCPGNRERLWIRVETDDGDVGVVFLDQNRQRAGAAADIEYTLPRTNGAEFDQLFADRIAAEQPVERIVKRQQPIVTGGRNITVFVR